MRVMRIAVLKERAAGEHRVALVPESVSKLVKAGAEVMVERGAGQAAGFPDASYQAVGAALAGAADEALSGADVVLKVQPPTPDEAGRLPSGAVLISLLPASSNGDLLPQLASRNITALAPRAGAAHHASAVDGRAVVAGDRRRLQGGAARRLDAATAAADDDDGGRIAHPGQGVRASARGGRTAGDRNGAAAGRRGVGLRRAARGEGTGAVARRVVCRRRRDRRRRRGTQAGTRGRRPRTNRPAPRRRWPATSRTWTW